MFTVYGDVRSGNCYKVKLLLSYLNLPYRWVNVDILQNETTTQAFLTKNPVGKIPLLELPSGEFLSESNAILYFLADKSLYLPDSVLERSRVLQWLFFEQYSHEPYIAVARFITKYLGSPNHLKDTFKSKEKGGYKALSIMEKHLNSSDFFVGETMTIADIALYAYTHVADEGGFDLSSFIKIQTWFERIASQPKHIPIG